MDPAAISDIRGGLHFAKMLEIMKKITVLLALLSIVSMPACRKKDQAPPTAPKQEQPPKNNPPPSTPPEETAATNTNPSNAQVTSFPKQVAFELIEKQQLVFGEIITMLFEQTKEHLYTFKKSYIGKVDDGSFWLQQGDDITITSPWKVISADLKKMKIYGGRTVGEGAIIGNIRYDGHQFQIDMLAETTTDKKQQQIVISKISALTKQSLDPDCPLAINVLRACDLYNGIYAAMTSIDYAAMGEVGPAVASEVMSGTTIVNLATSVFKFKPEVDQIRSQYLVPMLKAIGQLKKLNKIDKKNRELYLQQSKIAYANLTITTLDTLLKTQKMLPEAALSANATVLGSVLAYVGMNSAGDRVIALGQPAWVRELIAPIIREYGVLAIDLLVNGTNTPLQKRIDRFMAMEAQLKDAVAKICRSSPKSAQNECKEALSQ